MTETVTIDRPSVAKPVSRPRSRKPAPVTASAVAEHVGCSRQNIARLVAEKIIEQRADGRFDLDACRLRYIAHLRDSTRTTPRSEAAAELARSKQRMLDLRIMQREGTLMRVSEHEETIDELCGLVRTELSGLPARVGQHDLGVRRRAELVCRETLTRMAKAAASRADELEAHEHVDDDGD